MTFTKKFQRKGCDFLMSLFTAKGSEVKEQINKERVDLKEAFFRLKAENESVPVRVLGTEDYVAYKAHSDFKKGLYNTPCLSVTGQDCPYCTASKQGGEEWKNFYAKDRFMFAFGDLNSGQVKILEVSKNQAKKLIQQIDEYSDEIKAGEVAFNLTRTGSGTSTAYSLNMITPKKMKDIQSKFDAFNDVVVDEEFFEERLVAKSPTYMLNLLEDAGFPIDKHFDAELVNQARTEKQQLQNGGDDVTPIYDTDEDIL